MAPKQIDQVEERIVELQSAIDDLQSTLGRLHETIDLIEPETIDLRETSDGPAPEER